MNHGARVLTGPYVIDGVVGVNNISSVAGMDDCLLPAWLSFWVIVSPDNVPPVAPDDGVIAIAAEQPVVHAAYANDRVVLAGRPLVHLQAFLGRPSGLAGACCMRRSRSSAGSPVWAEVHGEPSIRGGT